MVPGGDHHLSAQLTCSSQIEIQDVCRGTIFDPAEKLSTRIEV